MNTVHTETNDLGRQAGRRDAHPLTPTNFPSGIHTVSVSSLEHCLLPHCSVPEFYRDFARLLLWSKKNSIVVMTSQIVACSIL